MLRKGLRFVVIGLIMLAIGFMLSLYLTVPRYSSIFKSEVFTVYLEGGEKAYLFELMNFSVEFGAVWGYVTATSSINATLYIFLTYPNGTKEIIIDSLTANLAKQVQLLGCIIEEAFVTSKNSGVLEYYFELCHREEPPIGVVLIALMLVIIGSVFGLRGLTLIFSEAELKDRNVKGLKFKVHLKEEKPSLLKD